MSYKNIFILLLSFTFIVSCSSSNHSVDPDPVIPSKPEQGTVNDITVTLKDNGKALTNPGMGWNQAYYTFDGVVVPQGDDASDILDWLPCDIVYFRLSWAKIEPEEGKFNWKIIDDVANEWTAAGKRLAFKFYTNFLWDHSEKQATPLWVKDAGAKGVYLDHDGNHANDSWMANYSDPILMEKLGNFYKAVAEHFKGKEIEFIELGSIGRVGEGNSYQIGVNATQDEVKAHIDLLKKHFSNERLVINDDYGSVACAYAKSVGYGVDDHSIGVGSSTNPPGKGYNAAILDKFKDGKVTIGLENDTWLKPDEWYCKQMEASCANYCRIHVSPSRLLYDEVKPVVATMNLKMGYRFQFPTIIIPEQVFRGKEFSITYSMKNVGVGCCTVDCHPRFVFKSDNDTEVFGVTDTEMTGNMLQYGKDSVVIDRKVKATIPTSVSSSALTVYICLVDKEGKAIINLPYSATNASDKKLYKVTQIKLK